MPYKDPAAKVRRQRERRATAKANGNHEFRRGEYQARRVNDAESHVFLGVDGEGYTEHMCSDVRSCDGTCEHYYMCLIAGDTVLYTGKPLSTVDCLEFLSGLQPSQNTKLVAFAFDYDVTMILRDILREDPDVIRQLIHERRKFGEYVWWRGYGLDWRPRKHLTVKRRGETAVTIHDTFGFFQSSFVKALEDFQVGSPERRAYIAEMKAKRAEFDTSAADEIIEYSKEECRLLAELVGLIRDAGIKAKLNADPYEGPGPIAGKALKKFVGDKHTWEELRRSVPERVTAFAERAYYGGRFEILAHGRIPVPVYEYDLKSAYPAAMLELPCLQPGCGEWVSGRRSGAKVSIANLAWEPKDYDAAYVPGSAGPFPHRDNQGCISFPMEGSGWYWSPEIETAKKAGFKVTIFGAYSYMQTCDHRPFEWVEEMFEERKRMEAEKEGSGIVLKLTLNSLYGKMAQRKPEKGLYYHVVYAGLITSITRAKVYEVYAKRRTKTVMFATDAVFVTEPIPSFKATGKLGSWEPAKGMPYNRLTIYMPGVYFNEGEEGVKPHFKTRGIPKRLFTEKAVEFTEKATAFTEEVEAVFSTHLGLRLAYHWGANWHPLAGNWREIGKKYSSNPRSKRNIYETDGHLVDPHGDGIQRSYPYPRYGPDAYEFRPYKTVPYSTDFMVEIEEHVSDPMDVYFDGVYDGDL